MRDPYHIHLLKRQFANDPARLQIILDREQSAQQAATPQGCLMAILLSPLLLPVLVVGWLYQKHKGGRGNG